MLQTEKSCLKKCHRKGKDSDPGGFIFQQIFQPYHLPLNAEKSSIIIWGTNH